jgi:hypothetical protein
MKPFNLKIVGSCPRKRVNPKKVRARGLLLSRHENCLIKLKMTNLLRRIQSLTQNSSFPQIRPTSTRRASVVQTSRNFKNQTRPSLISAVSKTFPSTRQTRWPTSCKQAKSTFRFSDVCLMHSSTTLPRIRSGPTSK